MSTDRSFMAVLLSQWKLAVQSKTGRLKKCQNNNKNDDELHINKQKQEGFHDNQQKGTAGLTHRCAYLVFITHI